MESVKESVDHMKDDFQRRMAAFEEELHKHPSGTSGAAGLAVEFAHFKTFTLQSLSGLQEQICMLWQSLDRLEMRGRRKMILVHGVPEEKDEDVPSVLVQLVQDKLKAGVFSSSDIRRCHRLGRTSSAGKPRPIVCKLQDVTVRDKLWFSKTKLKGTGFTMSEFLTKTRHNAFMLAREKFGVTKCWTREGTIHIVAPDGSRHRASTISEVNGITQQVSAAPAPVPVAAPAAIKSTKPKRAATVAGKK